MFVFNLNISTSPDCKSKSSMFYIKLDIGADHPQGAARGKALGNHENQTKGGIAE
jgi:hypothetical protein